MLQSYLADPNVWFKAETDKARNKYYTYTIVYVDGFLIVDKDPRKYMEMLDSKYTVKPSSIEEPKFYLVSGVGKVLYGDGYYAWAMSCNSYFKETIKNVKKRIE